MLVRMAFRMRKLNHSPQWYREHCKDENAPPLVHAMLKNDMKFFDADYDPKMTDEEKIGDYSEVWDMFLSGRDGFREGGRVFSDTHAAKAMTEVLERELLDTSRPTDIFKDEPYNGIDGLISEHKVSAAHVRQFLKAFEGGESFTKEPFATISRLMRESGLDSRTMKHFLKWRGRRVGVKTRERNTAASAEKKKSIPPEDQFIDYGRRG